MNPVGVPASMSDSPRFSRPAKQITAPHQRRQPPGPPRSPRPAAGAPPAQRPSSQPQTSPRERSCRRAPPALGRSSRAISSAHHPAHGRPAEDVRPLRLLEALASLAAYAASDSRPFRLHPLEHAQPGNARFCAPKQPPVGPQPGQQHHRRVNPPRKLAVTRTHSPTHPFTHSLLIAPTPGRYFSIQSSCRSTASASAPGVGLAPTLHKPEQPAPPAASR